MKPLPNLATHDVAAAHSFGYMHASSRHDHVVKLCWPEGDHTTLSPVGPSPVIISLANLQKVAQKSLDCSARATFPVHTPRNSSFLYSQVAQKWLDCSYTLRGSPEPAKIIQDWVLEMWGWSIAAASMGVKHKIVPSFQIEPNAYARTAEDFHTKAYIFHYTYGIEYKLDGNPQGYNTIGEWSLDKRHYGGAYPPRVLDEPPAQANPSSKWLLRAWNEAMAAADNWPATNAMGTVGWRRESITPAMIAGSKLASAVVGTSWTWAGIKSMTFQPGGVLKTPWGEGKWGLALRPKGMPQCAPPNECLFADFSSNAHNLAFDKDKDGGLGARFASLRIGDGETVEGKRIHE